MWLYYAQFEIRQKNLPFARRALVSKGAACLTKSQEKVVLKSSCLQFQWFLLKKATKWGVLAHTSKRGAREERNKGQVATESYLF